MVSEKRAWAVAHNPTLLIQFLDATAVFDRTSHPVILSHLFNEGVEDDQWMYFDILHGNATIHIKWNGRISTEVIQGGYSSAIKEIEDNADFIAGAVPNVILVADDVVPCAVVETPREAFHRMQILLNIVEVHGTQNHMEVGKDKCERAVNSLLHKVEQ